MDAQSRSLKHVAWALAVGVTAGVALVTSYSFIEAWITAPAEGTTILSPSDVAFAALVFSFYYAVVITIICFPLWLLIVRVGLAGPIAAAFLGFATTLVFWMVSNYPALQSARSGLPYALCGTVAGLVTWWVGNRR